MGKQRGYAKAKSNRETGKHNLSNWFSAGASFFFSAVSMIFVARTFALSERPYLGIANTEHHFFYTPTKEMLWRIMVVNAGARPGMFKVEDYEATLTTKGRAVVIPDIDDLHQGELNIMPNQIFDIGGKFSEESGLGTLASILSGEAVLDVYVTYSYSAPSLFWNKRYTNKEHLRFRAGQGFDPAFVPISSSSH